MVEVEFLRYALVATSSFGFRILAPNADQVEAVRNLDQAKSSLLLVALFSSCFYSFGCRRSLHS
jgi:hypothetical protein